MEDLQGVFSAFIKDFDEIRCLIEEKIKMKNFIRISYYDGLYYVTTNAIFLSYPQTDEKSCLIDVIYLRPVFNSEEIELRYEIIRAECQMMQIEGEFIIESESRMFVISAKTVSGLIQSLNSLSQNIFTLTHLRKILSSKNAEKSIWFDIFDEKIDKKFVKKITLQLVMNLSSIILIQKEENNEKNWSNINYFAKSDIISYYNFLKIAEIFLTKEKIEFRDDVTHIKLHNVLNRIRNRKRAKKEGQLLLNNNRRSINENPFPTSEEITIEEAESDKN